MNSVAYVKSNVLRFRTFAVSVIRSYRIELYFFRSRSYQA